MVVVNNVIGGALQPSVQVRQSARYDDTVIAALLARVSGKSLATVNATAALESCAGFVGRAFASAEITGRPIITNALTPECMELVGRSLMRRGEQVFVIDVSNGMLKLLPAETWDIDGSADPDSWEYRVTVGGPSGTLTFPYYPAQGVLHFKYAVDSAQPWRGNSPLAVAHLAGRLSAETVNMLADESSGPVGRLLPLPIENKEGTIEELKNGIRDARGRVATVLSGDWGNTSAGGVDGRTYRYGAEPGQPLVNLLKQASDEIYASCGFNPALFTSGDAASLRESYRIALAGTIQPLSKLVQSEINAKLDAGVSIDFTELRAADLSGRARAFQSMVGGGMDVAQAVAVAGLMTPE